MGAGEQKWILILIRELGRVHTSKSLTNPQVLPEERDGDNI